MVCTPPHKLPVQKSADQLWEEDAQRARIAVGLPAVMTEERKKLNDTIARRSFPLIDKKWKVAGVTSPILADGSDDTISGQKRLELRELTSGKDKIFIQLSKTEADKYPVGTRVRIEKKSILPGKRYWFEFTFVDEQKMTPLNGGEHKLVPL